MVTRAITKVFACFVALTVRLPLVWPPRLRLCALTIVVAVVFVGSRAVFLTVVHNQLSIIFIVVLLFLYPLLLLLLHLPLSLLLLFLLLLLLLLPLLLLLLLLLFFFFSKDNKNVMKKSKLAIKGQKNNISRVTPM